MIDVKDLKKTFKLGFWRKQHQAVKGISFQVEAGEIFGFIGPNGAGKTTTIKMLVGLLGTTAGSVSIMGANPARSKNRREVGFLPEYPYFYDYLNGNELLHYYGSLAGLNSAQLQSRIPEVAAMVGIKHEWLTRKLRTYSKGMTQRLGLAQAMINYPKLLILDEPMSGLDPLGRMDVRNLLVKLKAEGTTIFYSSHVLSDVEMICDRAALLIEGEIRRQGKLEEIVGKEGNLEEVLAQEAKRPV